MDTTVIVFQEDCILAAKGKDGAYPLSPGSGASRCPVPGIPSPAGARRSLCLTRNGKQSRCVSYFLPE